jgi:hypothetical protein
MGQEIRVVRAMIWGGLYSAPRFIFINMKNMDGTIKNCWLFG